MTSAILVSVAVHYGLGMDINDIKDPIQKMNAVKYLTIAPSPSIMSVAIGKISVVFLLHRLMGTNANRIYFWMLWITMFISISLSVGAVVVVLRFCSPTESIWNTNIQGTCIDPNIQLGVGLAQACKFFSMTAHYLKTRQSDYPVIAFNAFTDLVLAIFPAWIFWGLNMTIRRKIGLIMLMGVGVFGAAITSYKAYQLRNLPGHDNLTCE